MGLLNLIRKHRGKKGILIVIEGTDGTGKATQLEKLVRNLEENDHKGVRTIDFPRYDRLSSLLVRAYLNDFFGDADKVNPYIGSFFYAIDREVASLKMHYWLAKGDIVISNRLSSSSQAHQGGKIQEEQKRHRLYAFVDFLEHRLMDVPEADHTVLLKLSIETAMKLVGKKARRHYTGKQTSDSHERNGLHLEHALRTYSELAELYNWGVIDCEDYSKDHEPLPVEDISRKVYVEVGKYILK